MSDEWEAAVAAVWAAANDMPEDDVLAPIERLAAERPAGDAAALFERASAHDFAGREADAEPLYRAALEAGLDDRRAARAEIQLASTLRNLDRAREAIELLERATASRPDDELRDARAAFLALALIDAGRAPEAAALALSTLAPHLDEYGRAVAFYSAEVRTMPGGEG